MEKKTTLIIGLAIPVLMVLFVAGSIYLPSLFVKPQYNFIYASTSNFVPITEASAYYTVKEGRVVSMTNAQKDELLRKDLYGIPRLPVETTTLYHYDVKTDTAKEITLAEAKRYTLDPNAKSPDGFEMTSGRGGGGFFPFFYDGHYDYNARYLSGRNISKKLSLAYRANSDYYYSISFLGWIIP